MAQVGKIPVLTPEQLAERWQVSYATIMSMLNAGKLPHFKVQKQFRISITVVEEFEKTGNIPQETR